MAAEGHGGVDTEASMLARVNPWPKNRFSARCGAVWNFWSVDAFVRPYERRNCGYGWCGGERRSVPDEIRTSAMRTSVPRGAARVKWRELACATGGAPIFLCCPLCVQMPFLWAVVPISRQRAWLLKVR